MPTCFFTVVHNDVGGVTDFTIQGFVDFFHKYDGGSCAEQNEEESV